MKDFNEKMRRTQLARGWGNNEHNRWKHTHDSRAPFTEPRSAGGLASALIGVMCFFALILIALLLGAY